MTSRVLLVCAAGVWLAAAAGSAAQKQSTTNDGIYSKKQADAAKEQFDKVCADCHPFTVAGKKKPKDVPLGEDPFYDNWTGRPVSQMITTIALTMPNDGSAVVTEEEAANLVAYILQQNGFVAGEQPLTKATATAIVERPKK